MKIVKFYMITMFVVALALLYVHQHVEIVKSSYILKSNEIKAEQLLDQNGALMYNIEKLENPYCLEEKLQSNNIVLTMPEKWHIVSSGGLEKEAEVASSTESKKRFFDFLVPKALAHEKPTTQ